LWSIPFRILVHRCATDELTAGGGIKGHTIFGGQRKIVKNADAEAEGKEYDRNSVTMAGLCAQLHATVCRLDATSA
jgi:hypothetical protein